MDQTIVMEWIQGTGEREVPFGLYGLSAPHFILSVLVMKIPGIMYFLFILISYILLWGKQKNTYIWIYCFFSLAYKPPPGLRPAGDGVSSRCVQ